MSGGGSANGYVIERSLRFSAASSQYLTRTLSSNFGGQIATFSFWVKRGALGVRQVIFGASNGSTTAFGIEFNSADQLDFFDYFTTYQARKVTSRVFRDPSALYHIECTVNTPSANASSRFTVKINGILETTFSSSIDPSQNLVTTLSLFNTFNIGREAGTASGLLDGYLAEINVTENTTSSFGEINTSTGQWVAKKYTGTYGTNGFYLDFKDGTSTTTLGYDKSGNNNHWTLTNFTRSAGVNDCWMLDVPAGNGSASAVQPSGNYAVLNPLDAGVGTNITLSNANLNYAQGATNGAVRATIGMLTGKWYWEATVTATNPMIGISNSLATTQNYPGSDANGWAYYGLDGTKYTNGTSIAYGAAYTTSDVIGVAFDADNGTLTFYKNNVSQGTAFTGLTSGAYFPAIGRGNGSPSASLNFGQRSFTYTPPAGFKALCTANLTSTDVIESGSFTGNANAIGPFIWCNGTPETLTINGNAVTWGTHADKLSNGFKLRTSSSSYNSSGTNTWTATILSPESKSAFKHQNAKGN